MPKVIEIPGVGNVEFPDSMSDDQIAEAAREQIVAQKGGSVERFVSGVGRGMGSGLLDVAAEAGAESTTGLPGEPTVRFAAKLGKGLIDSHLRELTRAKEAFDRGDYKEALGSGVFAAIPGVGPLVSHLADTAASGDVAGALGELTGVAALPVGAAKVGAMRSAGKAAQTRAGIMERMGVAELPKAVKPGLYQTAKAFGKLLVNDPMEVIGAMRPSLKRKLDLVMRGQEAAKKAVAPAVETSLAAESAPALSARLRALLEPEATAAPVPVAPSVAAGIPQALEGGGVRMAPVIVMPEPGLQAAPTVVRDPATGRMVNLATARPRDVAQMPARVVAEQLKQTPAAQLKNARAQDIARQLAAELEGPGTVRRGDVVEFLATPDVDPAVLKAEAISGARGTTATKVARAMNETGITAAAARKLSPEQWKQAVDAANPITTPRTKPPSSDTIGEILRELKKLERTYE